MEPFWERCSLKNLGILWSLKEEIKKDFFDAVPVEAKKDYTDLLEHRLEKNYVHRKE